ncbi:MAG: HD domain-containing phosphohydrolase, partial [Pyrinomonadaceae bacterium]
MTEPHGARERILIIDDEAEIRNLLSELLSDRYDCVTVASAEAALALLPGERFQLVLSDVMMSGMTGVAMIPLMRRLAPETVIMLVSGTQNIEVSIEAMRAGAFDYILKPFDLDQVELAVGRALEHFRLREEKRRYEARLEQTVAERTGQLNRALDSVEEAYRMTLKALTTALETRDTETHGHSERVVSFSLHLGRAMGLDAAQLRSLEFGAMLHDIGKIGIPDCILRKPGKLDEQEWVKMRQHPTLGGQILNGIEFLEGAARVVGQHHERWDGAGYPRGLSGNDIDLNARIFAVADAFDALISDRVYRSGRSYEEA